MCEGRDVFDITQASGSVFSDRDSRVYKSTWPAFNIALLTSFLRRNKIVVTEQHVSNLLLLPKNQDETVIMWIGRVKFEHMGQQKKK